MGTGTASELLDVLSTLRLMEPQRLAALADRDAASVIEELLTAGCLTQYQAGKLLHGNAGELVLGSYVLLDQLGEGGMGQVFKACHCNLGRIVALKVIRKERLTNAETVKRFHREIEAAAQLSHPNVVHAFDADQVGDAHFFTMEYVDGTDLAQLVKESGPLPIAQACDYIRQAALGLQHAHEKGLIHRDVKPSNLLLAQSKVQTPKSKVEEATSSLAPPAPNPLLPSPCPLPPVIKVLDLGLARWQTTADGVTTLTETGTILGTPDYISPEQARDGHDVDIRGDLYSLGCTLYYLLTGQPPFPGGTLTGKLLRHQLDEPEAVESLRKDMPARVAGVVRRLMAKKREDRYQTPGELAGVLAEGLATGNWPAPPASPSSQTAVDSAESWARVVAEPTQQLVQPRVRPEDDAAHRMHKGVLIAGGCAAAVFVTVVLLLLWSPWDRPPAVAVATRRGEPLPTTKSTKNLPAVAAPAEPGQPILNSLGMKLVYIPAGDFLMGAAESDDGREPNEGPAHRVRISKAFYMGACEVTQGHYQHLLGKNPATNPESPEHPVETVSWEDATEFCKRLSSHPEERTAGRRYRLPTEAEWEYACRAGTMTLFHVGDSLSLRFANCQAPYGIKMKEDRRLSGNSVKVGSYGPNAWGLHDMHGNVAEWCLDSPRVYSDDGSKHPIVDPRGLTGSGARAVRGGSFASVGLKCASARRAAFAPHLHFSQNGFRVVCETGAETIGNSIGMQLAPIPAGRFFMGAAEREEGAKPNESPRHEVVISKPFHGHRCLPIGRPLS